MNWIKQIFLIFLYILACTIIASAFFISFVYSNVNLDVMFLWQTILLSAICSLATFVYFSKHEHSKRQLLIRKAIHFTTIVAVMLIGSIYFKWISVNNVWNIVFMLLSILIVYIVVNIIFFIDNKKVAKQLNQRLEQRRSEEQGLK